MIKTLNDDKMRLILKANKTTLKELVDTVSVLTSSDYTADSWLDFENALENAKAVSAKENASQAEIDQAIAALTSARAGLVKATDQTTQAISLNFRNSMMNVLDSTKKQIIQKKTGKHIRRHLLQRKQC
mgnify:CR=1 FL=1